MAASYTFLPWVRQGVVGAIDIPDPLNGSLKSRVELEVAARLNNNTADDATIKVRVYGPGDVTGFDARQVIRTEPQHLTSDFEPNYFPFIEFDRPDFPWMFTPAKANDNEQLRPWICLVVVEKGEDNLKVDPSQPLPVLKADAKTELPDLSESWAWAHAQVSGSTTTDLDNVLAKNPERTLSRLLAPLKLQPNTSYYACVIPTFEIGRKVGLGEAVKDGEREPDEFLKRAWEGNTVEIELPVYYHWEFATGAAGDFESLVWLLQRKQFSSQEVGTRKVQVKNPDPDNPWSEIEKFEKIPLEGALRPYQDQAQNQDDPLKPLQDNEDYKKFQEKLRALLNWPEDPKSTATLPSTLPIAPPIYGRWHAAQKTIPDGTRDAAWLRELNLNPSHRAAASIGTQIVQDQQEQLMASAWEQVGEIEKANQFLRQAQMARTAGTTVYEQHLEVLAEQTFFALTGPVHSRALIDPRLALDPAPTGMIGARTIFAITSESRLPEAVAQGAFRRLLRPRGPLARRLTAYGGLQPGRLLRRLNDGEIQAVPARVPLRGMVTMDRLLGALERAEDRFCAVTPDRVQEAMQVPSPESLDPLLADLDQLLASPNLPTDAREHLERAQQNLLGCQDLLRSLSPPLSLANLQRAIELLSAARNALTEAMAILAGSAFFDTVDNIRISLDRIMPPQEEIPRLLFGIAASEHQRDMEPCDPPPPRMKPGLDFKAIKTTMLEQLNPAITIVKRIKSRIVAPSYWKPDDELEPIMAAPDFPTPMYKPLAELSQDLILPGLERVPPNTITLLETNPRFVEAYMIGLNHEMSRELLWREFPTDQRGTYFRQFWDPRGKVPAPKTSEEKERAKDLKPITDWKDSNQLGSSMEGGGARGQTVMLIRGDLLRRYPRAIIYAAKADWSKDENDDNVEPRTPVKLVGSPGDQNFPERYPIFQGTLTPDITFLGFDLPLDEARGSENPGDNKPGWFFVIQQQPTEPRYGLDETKPDTLTGTWRDLSFKSVKLTPTDHVSLDPLHDPDDKTQPYSSPTESPDMDISWGSNSAAMAFITLQGPFRVAIHASDLLPSKERRL